MIIPFKQVFHLADGRQVKDPLHEDMQVLNKWSLVLDLTQHLGRQKGREQFFVACLPEHENSLDERNDKIAALNMALFAQEMDKQVLSPVDLIEIRGHVAQDPFGADLIKKDRHELGELFDQVIDRLDRMVQQLGNVALKKIGVLDAGACELEVDDQGGKESGTPLWLLHDQVEPDTDIGQMGRVGYRLPVLVHAAHVCVLKTEADRLPQKGLHQPAVAPVKNLGAKDLDALQ